MALALALRQLLPSVARQTTCSSFVSLRDLSSTPAWRQEGQEDGAARRAHINRLLYRSRQRGWLELDLLIGMWAERSLPHLSREELADFEKVLALENPDLFKWLTGQLDPPAELRVNKAYQLISRHVGSTMAEKSQQPAQASKGTEWKRGWDDWKGEALVTEVEEGTAAGAEPSAPK